MVPAAKTLQVGGCFLRVLAHERQPCKKHCSYEDRCHSDAGLRLNATQSHHGGQLGNL